MGETEFVDVMYSVSEPLSCVLDQQHKLIRLEGFKTAHTSYNHEKV